MIELLRNKSLTMTIYSPETISSRLEGHIDLFIMNNTNARPVYRFETHLDRKRIKDFYANSSNTKDALTWEAIFELFESNHSLVTFWKGKDIMESMIRIKGNARPSIASPNSIRGRFWCDSPLCNLLHSSDSIEEMLRELSIIDGTTHLNKEEQNLDNLTIEEDPFNNISHSGIIVLSKIITSYLNKFDDAIKLVMPIYKIGISREANLVYEKYLVGLSNNSSIPFYIKDSINLYLKGDMKFLDVFLKLVEISEWDKLILKCSLYSRKYWISN